MTTMNGLERWVAELEFSVRRFRHLSWLTGTMLGITCVCTVYGSYHVNRDMMVGCIFMWLIFGILHVAFRTIYREDKGCLDDIRKNKYKISVMECISVNSGGEHVDTDFELRREGKMYRALGSVDLALNFIPIFDIPNHAPVYVDVIDVHGRKHVLCRHDVTDKHVKA